MGKRLVIAEKPSVAADLARALGRLERKGDYYEGADWIVASAIGHLVELCLPGELDPKRGKWSMANLPILPEEFGLKPVEKTRARLELLRRLVARRDVIELVNGCDAGREGELIFRYLARHLGVTKPVRRLWLQSMTEESIREAFGQLRTDSEMRPLADAALCRSESDWLVGINGTRAMTAVNSRGAGFQLTPVGRVQTPTLAILVAREERIRAFQPRTYYEVHGEFSVGSGLYRGRWFDEKFEKGTDDERRPERIWDRAEADLIVERTQGRQGTVSEQRKPGTQASPSLFDLTSLQREANSRLGFSARRTLALAQRLYERHKLLTYPRTDSRHLPEDYVATVRHTLANLHDPTLAGFARRVLEAGWVRAANRRIFNAARVTDHHAIIPTGHAVGRLDESEARLYDMVARRFVAAFYPPAEFEVATRITRVGGDPFKTEGKVILRPGWMEVYGRAADGPAEALPAVAPGESALAARVFAAENQTRPPARFNEATLLSAMEGAGKLVEDEDLREAMAAKGLGTPATRAAIIEGLILDNYVQRRGRDLVATAKGISLVALLRTMGVELLCSPELTGEWEFKLKGMEEDRLDRPSFMTDIRQLTREIVERARAFDGGTAGGSYADLEATCPKCRAGTFREDYRSFECAGCGLRIWKTVAGRGFEREEVKTLLEQGRLGPLDGFRSRQGRAFSAVVRLGAEHKVEFEFGDGGGPGSAPVDLGAALATHPCPRARDGLLHEFDLAYYCLLPDAGASDPPLRIGKRILQRDIPPEQAVRLVTDGRTDLLRGFISKRGKPFAARLALEGGKVTFVFETERRHPARRGAPAAAHTPGEHAHTPRPSTGRRASKVRAPGGRTRSRRRAGENAGTD